MAGYKVISKLYPSFNAPYIQYLRPRVEVLIPDFQKNLKISNFLKKHKPKFR